MIEDKPPIFIIGAARSGTNMLRDILSSIPSYCTWNCDEINPILRHGNLIHQSDLFTKEMATPKISSFIKAKFRKISLKHDGAQVIEKTCANTLRIPFLLEIFPDAKFIYIYRDGRDATASAIKKWHSTFNLSYSLKKAKYIPIIDFPYYFWKFGKLRIAQLFTHERLKFWGVQIPDIQKIIKTSTIEEIAAWQWSVCNQHSFNNFKSMENNKVKFISYEKFVLNPTVYLNQILTFIGSPKMNCENLCKNVRPTSIGKYKNELSTDQVTNIEKIIATQMNLLEYNICESN